MGILQSQPLRPHLHLCRRLLARDIHALQPRPRKGRHRLQQECRLADPGITAHQNGRGRDEPATQNPVQFRHARGGARRRLGLRGQIGQRDGTPLGDRALGARGQGRFLDQRVPRHAGVALAVPLLVACATGRAGEGMGSFTHAAFMPEPQAGTQGALWQLLDLPTAEGFAQSAGPMPASIVPFAARIYHSEGVFSEMQQKTGNCIEQFP